MFELSLFVYVFINYRVHPHISICYCAYPLLLQKFHGKKSPCNLPSLRYHLLEITLSFRTHNLCLLW